ncbi:hypothetical protein [Sphingomonas sp.]|uniref:hypothetical protein n=1 Tax=Sphingomonas sp. TaxID=28214 RepID=UPI003AFFD969
MSDFDDLECAGAVVVEGCEAVDAWARNRIHTERGDDPVERQLNALADNMIHLAALARSRGWGQVFLAYLVDRATLGAADGDPDLRVVVRLNNTGRSPDAAAEDRRAISETACPWTEDGLRSHGTARRTGPRAAN